jgi:hypothetical protein
VSRALTGWSTCALCNYVVLGATPFNLYGLQNHFY